MAFIFEREFREAHPETIGETDSIFDLSNYNEWLELRLTLHVELVKELSMLVEELTKNPWVEGNPSEPGSYLVKQTDGFVQMMFWDGENWRVMWGDNLLSLSSDVKQWTEVPQERVREGKI